jgi:RNA-directed DNA polymerase
MHLQDLQRRIYRKVKSDKTHRFWGIFVHITKMETLRASIQTKRARARHKGMLMSEEPSER